MPAEQLHRHDAGRGQLGQDLREAHARDVRERRAEADVVGGLEAQVGLLEDAGEQVLEVADGVRQAKRRVEREGTCEEPEDGGVALHARAHVRPQHLDRDLAPGERARAVHLRDACRRDGRVVELREALGDGGAEVFLEDAADLAIGNAGTRSCRARSSSIVSGSSRSGACS